MTPLALDHAPRQGPGLVTAELDGELLVFDEQSGAVHELNPTAAAVWSVLDGRTTMGQLAADLARRYGADRIVVEADVLGLVERLSSEGLLDGPADMDRAGPQATPRAAEVLSPERVRTTRVLDRVDWAYVSGRYRALDFDFAFRVPDAALGQHLANVFAPLREDGEPAHVYSLVDRGEGRRRRFALYLDGVRVECTDPPRAATAMLPWHVNRMAVQRSPRFLCLHAAAVAFDGAAVLLAAPQKAGKTTLATGLVRAGMRYLTDEAVAIDPRTLLVHPYPKALSIDKGAQPLFADLRPEVDVAALGWDHGQWAVDPRRIRPDAIGEPAPASTVVLPSYDPAAETELSPISRADAVLELVKQAFNFPLHGRRGFETLVGLVGDAPCYRLVVSDLDTAVDAVAALVTDRRRIA